MWSWVRSSRTARKAGCRSCLSLVQPANSTSMTSGASPLAIRSASPRRVASSSPDPTLPTSRSVPSGSRAATCSDPTRSRSLRPPDVQRRRSHHHELCVSTRDELEPRALRAHPRQVRRVGPLGDHAVLAAIPDAGEELLRGAPLRGRHQQRAARSRDRVQERASLAPRQRSQVAPPVGEQVECDVVQSVGGIHLATGLQPREHGRAVGAVLVVEQDDLAVHDPVVGLEHVVERLQLGEARGTVATGAARQAERAVGVTGDDPHAVPLHLERPALGDLRHLAGTAGLHRHERPGIERVLAGRSH